jgi:hypothetical protein
MTMPRLAFNRKDTGRIDWRAKAPGGSPFGLQLLKALALWRYRGWRRQMKCPGDHIAS